MTITINKKQALDLLEQAVQKRGPDHVQEICQYWQGARRPGCIVGTALHLGGVRAATLRKMDVLDNSVLTSTDIGAVFKAADIDITPAALSALRHAQVVQDCKRPWSEALYAAKAGEIPPRGMS